MLNIYIFIIQLLFLLYIIQHFFFFESLDKISAAHREVHFFDRDDSFQNGNWTWYREQMAPCTDDQISIEKTPRYFVVRKALRRMKVE